MAITLKEGDLKKVPVQHIIPNPDSVAIRGVKMESAKFKELVSSIRERGIQNPIALRPLLTKEGEPTGMYGLVDGLHRFRAAQVLHLDTVPAYIRPVGDDEIIEEQLVGNIQRIAMRPAEEANAIFRHLLSHPNQKVDEVAQRLGKTGSWVNQRLSITKLPTVNPDDIDAETGEPRQPWGGVDVQKDLVDTSKITPANAYQLAKFMPFDPPIPDQLWTLALEKAQSMTCSEFTPWVQIQVNQVKEARRTGKKMEQLDPNVRVPVLRGKAEILTHYQRLKLAAEQKEALGETVPEYTRGVIATLEYALQIDDKTWAARQELAQRKKEEAEAKKADRLAGKMIESLTLGGLVDEESVLKALRESEVEV